MEEDIKILEEKIKKMVTGIAVCRGNNDTDYARIMNKEKQALENLIKRYRELEQWKREEGCSIQEVYDLFIPKSKVKEKIEETNQEKLNYSEDEWYLESEIKAYAIEKLQELMED